MMTVFWTSLVTLLYMYAGYPLLVWALARCCGNDPQRRRITPTVSLLIPAYNEEAHIEVKLRNSLALDYPKEQFEIIVASDGSTDRTNAIVQRFVSHGVRLIVQPDNIGKSATLNRVIPQVRGEILVCSDASSELVPDALRRVVANFADPNVGCVSGLYRLKRAPDLRAQGEGFYWAYETFIKRQESRLGSILGAHGAFYAIRRALFQPLQAGSINDDYLIPMRIVARGYRAVYEPRAIAWEHEDSSVQGEFARRRRIAAGNCQQMVALRQLLDPRRGFIALSFFSHKVLRTFAPLLMIALFVSTLWLPFHQATAVFLLQSAFYASALIGHLLHQTGRTTRWLSFPLYFCLGNLAMLAGLLRYCFGRQHLVWGRAR